MTILSPHSVPIDSIIGEECLQDMLQKDIVFSVNDRIIKTGRVLLHRQAHFYINITLGTSRNYECFEIPIPLSTECYPEDGLWYFDYRLKCVCKDQPLESFLLPKTAPSLLFDSILEISTKNP